MPFTKRAKRIVRYAILETIVKLNPEIWWAQRFVRSLIYVKTTGDSILLFPRIRPRPSAVSLQ